MKKFYIDQNSSTKKAINQINKLGGQSLVVVKNKNILKGILSFADLRRAITNKNILNKNISKIYNKKPKYIFSDEVRKNFSDLNFKIKLLNILPVIDRKTHKIVGSKVVLAKGGAVKSLPFIKKSITSLLYILTILQPLLEM